MHPESIAVLGAGPVGLTLALDLAQRGVEVALVERRAADDQRRVKCNHISARSMEIFRRLGVAAALRTAGLPEDFCEAIHILYKCALEESEFGLYYYDQFTQRLLQHIVAEGYDRNVQHMQYIMTILRKTIEDAPTIH